MRKLASIQRVRALEAIDGADNIELAHINGWQCVVKKGEFEVGDLAVYFEIDAIPPRSPAFEFLYAKGGFTRIRTMKLRGALSQGLLLPFDSLMEYWMLDENRMFREDDDVTDFIGVTKYDKSSDRVQAPGMSAFPSWVSKTDEERIQSAPRLLRELQGLPYYITVKYDGMSATFTKKDGELIVCSRNYAIERNEGNAFWQMAIKYSMEEWMQDGDIIQGELCGPGIQGNKLNLKENDLFVFNVGYAGRHYPVNELIEFCEDYGLKHVPIIEMDLRFDYTLEELLVKAEGKYDGTSNEREGIVVRPIEYMLDSKGNRLSFKVISNKFLLKEK